MAEFCLDCWNRINKTSYGKEKYVISKDLDFCEGCGKWKPVVIMERNSYYMYDLANITLLFKFVFRIICAIWNFLYGKFKK